MKEKWLIGQDKHFFYLEFKPAKTVVFKRDELVFPYEPATVFVGFLIYGIQK